MPLHLLLLALSAQHSPIEGYNDLTFGASVMVARLTFHQDIPAVRDDGQGHVTLEMPVEVVGITAKAGLIFDHDSFVMAMIAITVTDSKQAVEQFERIEKGLTAKYGKPDPGYRQRDTVRKRAPGEVDHFLILEDGGRIVHMLAFFDPRAVSEVSGAVDTRGL